MIYKCANVPILDWCISTFFIKKLFKFSVKISLT